MSLFLTAARSPRLRYELVHQDPFDPYEMYEHARAGAPDVESITRWVTWDPHPHPRETAEFVERVGEQFDDEQGVTFALHPRDGEDGAGEFAGMAGLHVE
jgi:RimJ/RimL family protein N-acetyltransferase